MKLSVLFQTLREDHDKIADLFSRLESSRKERDLLRGVFDLQNAVNPHFLAEEREVLPHLAEAGEGAAAAQRRREHDEIRRELETLARLPVDTEAFEAQVVHLYDFWKRHVGAEEEVFAQALERLGAETSGEILQRYQSERDRHVRGGPDAARNWF